MASNAVTGFDEKMQFAGPPDGMIDASAANRVRQRVGKPGFAYLWEKVGLLDREIAEPFLQLEGQT